MPPFPIILRLSVLLGSALLVPPAFAQESPPEVSKPYKRPARQVREQHWTVAPEFLGSPGSTKETMEALRQKGVVFPENEAWHVANYSRYNEQLKVRSSPAVLKHVDTLVQQFMQEEQEQLAPKIQCSGMPALNDVLPGFRKYYRALARLSLGTLDLRFNSPEAALLIRVS